MAELIGNVYKKIDEDSGILLAEDEKKYYYTSSEFLSDFDLEQGDTVKFRPSRIVIRSTSILKATYISKVLKKEQEERQVATK